MAKNKKKSKSGGGGGGCVTIRVKKSSGKKVSGKKSSGKKTVRAATVRQLSDAGVMKAAKKVHALLAPSLSSSVARAVALPLSYNARVPDPWDTREVALANPYVVQEVEFTGAAAQWSLMGPGTTCYAVSRDPMRWLMKYNRNLGATWTYGLTWNSSAFDVNGMYRTQRLNLTNADTVQQLDFVDLDYRSGAQAYGEVQYPACDENYCWIWIDAKNDVARYTQLIFQVFPTPTGGSPATPLVGHYGDVWLLGASEPLRAELNLGGTATGFFDLKQSGYYRFSYTAPDPVGLGWYLDVSIVGTCDSFEFMPVPGLASRSQDIPELRTVGSSLMLSPKSTQQAEGGLVVGLQIPEGEFPTTYLNLSTSGVPADAGTLDRMLSARHAKTLDASKGIYGWHKPTAEADMGFQKPFIYNSLAQSSDPALPNSGRTRAVGYRGALYPKGGWMLLAWKGAPNPVTGLAYPGCNVKVTAAIAINFDTESVWYDVRKASGASAGALVEVRAMLENVEQFTENPFHFKDITNWIRKNSDTLKGLAKKGLTAFTGAFAPEALPLAAAINGLY